MSAPETHPSPVPHPAPSFRPGGEDFRALVRLALPIVVVQVGLMLMGVVDSVLLGHVSAANLAAGALGNLYVFGVIGIGMGTLMALDPVWAAAGSPQHVFRTTPAELRRITAAIVADIREDA